MAKSEWKSDPVQTGINIRKRRKELGWTQAQLAEEMGDNMTDKTISKYERGVHTMGIQTLYDFAEALHTTPDKLSPNRFEEEKKDYRMEEIESLYNSLDDSKKDMAYALMKNIILTLQGKNESA
ncbi:MAG: helix-turn-helix domain-containing protein [Lachnospiraceae bacterium]|nr:helix-turn-helix domain-containing protein [Lachnospiraceae bacterium]